METIKEVFCDQDCRFLLPNEEFQKDNTIPHHCYKYNETVFHSNSRCFSSISYKLNLFISRNNYHPEILKCYPCLKETVQ